MTVNATNKPAPIAFMILMILMGTVGLVSLDIYILAMPNILEEFGSTKEAVQSSFTLYLMGLCVGQLFFGNLMRRLSTKTTLLISMFIFMAGCLGCAFANSLVVFVFFRCVQAFGASACSVAYRSIVAARYNKQQVAQLLAIIFPVAGLSPGIAPYVGHHLNLFWGWRSIFVVTAGYGALVLLLVLFYLNEDKQQEARPMAATPHVIPGWVSYLQVLQNRNFIGYALMVAMAYSAFRCFTAESPFIIKNLGFESTDVAHLYLLLSAMYVIGNLTTRFLLQGREVDQVLKMGLWLMLFGGMTMVIVGWTGLESPLPLFLSMSLITCSNGFLVPCGSAAALTRVPSALTGIAAALIGTIQLVSAVLCMQSIGLVARGQFLPLAGAILFISLLAILSYIGFIVRKVTNVEVSDSV